MSTARNAVLGLAVIILSLFAAWSPGQAASRPAKVQPVDFHKLQELMPEQAVGVPRSNVDGENMDIGELSMSRARADYLKPDSDGSDPNAAIEIADYGASPQLVAGMAAWRMAPVNIQNDEGYQRTVKFKEYPAFETYTRDGDARQMMILVADRFLVTLQTNHVSEADLKQLAESLPWEELANLK
jgi:hypothetical protein